MNKVKGFLKRDKQKLINGAGEEILLRGVGFGSWLLPEGYMWLFPENGDRPRRIEKMVRELVGSDQAAEFWDSYYNNFIREADLKKIAEEGFNSIRLPINSRFLLKDSRGPIYHEEHLKLIDRVIKWCRENKLYVILDLHGAPGGQTGTNIDDSENDLPELFLEDKYKDLTIDIWEKLAERYKDQWIVAGYDLLNEPLPNWFSKYNERLLPLYQEIIAAIRKIDKKHMIILEGLHWSTDWSIFKEKIDHNLMLQFHKYWNNPDTESISQYLKKRDELELPIFMGEGGENNKEWYTGAFQLFEDHQISWNFWTWKKMSTSNSPCSIKKPDGWSKLINYLNGGAKPEKASAAEILEEYLDNIIFDNCVYHQDVVRAIFRRPALLIPAVFYNYQGENKSFYLKEYNSSQVDFRSEDRTKIKFIDSDRKKANFEHQKGEAWKKEDWLALQLDEDEWSAYDFNLEDSLENTFCKIALSLKVNGDKNAAVEIIIDDQENEVMTNLSSKKWLELSFSKKFKLSPGKHQIVVKTAAGSIDLKWLKLKSL
ncbi:glycoside hydrolase family 5 protein [Halanaerobium kushneri]|uniref:Cellulase (Glycosyl hydrolase family 5) n=1 Tax=Halanaerobium kushneri TaxID=56779 RepID=A0A1N6RXW4_9FIRM|nr:glycoside hydrolase family 5 protein [Halanaerobium kushneri]SIQ33629.1 Cellulase (glycosyl hydrolase family 5) [Halanaerobium kushneri]